MGIVIKQSIRNTMITFFGFGIGALNTLFMYPYFLGKEYFGITGYVLATANVLYPIMSFGIQNTLIKFVTLAILGAFLYLIRDIIWILFVAFIFTSALNPFHPKHAPCPIFSRQHRSLWPSSRALLPLHKPDKTLC
jgi:hypothetical protein